MKSAARTMKVAFANIQSHEEFECAWKAFVEMFHESPALTLVAEEPELLVEKLQDDGLADAFLALIAAYLCQLYSLKQPRWPDQEARLKSIPWFAGNTPELRNRYLRKSPAAFRVRNLFVPADILARPPSDVKP